MLLGVHAREYLPPRTVFGPLIDLTNSTEEIPSKCSITFPSGDQEHLPLDTEFPFNWMKLISTETSESDRNAAAVSRDGNIYLIVTRNVLTGDELKITSWIPQELFSSDICELPVEDLHELSQIGVLPASHSDDDCSADMEMSMNYTQNDSFMPGPLTVKPTRIARKRRADLEPKKVLKKAMPRKLTVPADGEIFSDTPKVCQDDDDLLLNELEDGPTQKTSKRPNSKLIRLKVMLPDSDVKIRKPRGKPQKEVSAEKRLHMCLICAAYCEGREILTHVENHRTEGSFNCPRCPNSFKQYENLKEHYRKAHDILNPKTCLLCQKEFESSDILQIHLEKDHADYHPHSCLECHRKFPTEEGLNEHVACVHSSVPNSSKSPVQPSNVTVKNVKLKKIARCGVCNAGFFSKKNFLEHMEEAHPGIVLDDAMETQVEKLSTLF